MRESLPLALGPRKPGMGSFLDDGPVQTRRRCPSFETSLCQSASCRARL